jgi:assimilatory nitrate reductase catalytic subunit
MNPRDAKSLSLKPHDRVDVISARGRVKNVELRVTEIIAPGQVFMPFHYAEANANQVTQSAFDPISREPNYKQCAVRIERAQISPQYWGVRGSARARYEVGPNGTNSVAHKEMR